MLSSYVYSNISLFKFSWNDPIGEDDAILFATVDGIHFRVFEPRQDSSSIWYSYKHSGPGLTYEIGISTTKKQSTMDQWPVSSREVRY